MVTPGENVPHVVTDPSDGGTMLTFAISLLFIFYYALIVGLNTLNTSYYALIILFYFILLPVAASTGNKAGNKKNDPSANIPLTETENVPPMVTPMVIYPSDEGTILTFSISLLFIFYSALIVGLNILKTSYVCYSQYLGS